jgi:hypothetical protein
MKTKNFSSKGNALFIGSLLALLLFCFPTFSNAQSPSQTPDDQDYLATQSAQAPVGQGILQTLANLMVKRNEAVIMGIIQEVNLEKKTLKILNQTITFNSETTLLGGTKGMTGLKANQIVIITVQEMDSKLTAVEIFKMPKSSRKPL